MTIRDQEERLFKQWKDEGNCEYFVKDGVVNHEAYNASKRKIVFILKEYPAWEEGDYDLRCGELINPHGEGWKNVAKILCSINKWCNPEANNDGVPDKMPDNICAFNMMKERGDQYTDWKKLKRVAERDSEHIRCQFAIYDPDLTLCMGYNQQQGDMLDIFREVMGHTDQPEKQHTKKDGWGWYERSPGKIVVGAYHMSNRGQQSHEDVFEAVKEISENVQFGR